MHMANSQPSRVSFDGGRGCAAGSIPDQTKAIQRHFTEAALAPPELELIRQRHTREGQLQTLLEQIRAMPDGDDPNFSRAQLGAISADTLIVFGDRDPLYPVSLAIEFENRQSPILAVGGSQRRSRAGVRTGGACVRGHRTGISRR